MAPPLHGVVASPWRTGEDGEVRVRKGGFSGGRRCAQRGGSEAVKQELQRGTEVGN